MAILNCNMEKIKNKLTIAIKSITLNYKSWIAIMCAVIMISTNISKSMFSFFYTVFIAYYFHLSCHVETSYPFNAVHSYHHTHSNYMAHILQIMLEFVSILSIVVINNTLNLNLFCIWSVILFYIFYTTVHNINYSIYHVNHIHEKHHEILLLNVGPDICDILFDTKLNPETDLENTDHYINNITVSAIIVYIIQQIYYKNKTNATIINSVFSITYINFCLVLVIATIVIFLGDIYQNNQDNLIFNKKFDELKKKYNI